MSILNKLDINLTKKINNLISKNSILLRPLIYITNTSDGRAYIFYTFLIPLIAPIYGVQILKLGIPAYIFQLLVYLIVKNKIKRGRPSREQGIIPQIPPPDKYSFPSGHCASATLLVLVLDTFNLWLTSLLIPWMLIIYFSRIILGLHYVSDVLGGVLLGFTSFFVGRYISAYLI